MPNRFFMPLIPETFEPFNTLSAIYAVRACAACDFALFLYALFVIFPFIILSGRITYAVCKLDKKINNPIATVTTKNNIYITIQETIILRTPQNNIKSLFNNLYRPLLEHIHNILNFFEQPLFTFTTKPYILIKKE